MKLGESFNVVKDLFFAEKERVHSEESDNNQLEEMNTEVKHINLKK